MSLGTSNTRTRGIALEDQVDDVVEVNSGIEPAAYRAVISEIVKEVVNKVNDEDDEGFVERVSDEKIENHDEIINDDNEIYEQKIENENEDVVGGDDDEEESDESDEVADHKQPRRIYFTFKGANISFADYEKWKVYTVRFKCSVRIKFDQGQVTWASIGSDKFLRFKDEGPWTSGISIDGGFDDVSFYVER